MPEWNANQQQEFLTKNTAAQFAILDAIVKVTASGAAGAAAARDLAEAIAALRGA